MSFLNEHMKDQNYPKFTHKKSVGILGCGWLGMATAKVFLAEGWEVKGTVRSLEKLAILKAQGISAYPYTLGSTFEGIKKFSQDLELLIVAIPPGLRTGDPKTYLNHINLLKEQLSQNLAKNLRLLFISSTGVYPQNGGPFFEESVFEPDSEKSKALLDAENIIKLLPQEVIIVRFAGLVGEDREPVLSLSKRAVNPGGYFAANLIHQKDAVRLLLHLEQLKHPPALLNALYPQKIKKNDYYQKRAKLLNIKAPIFLDAKKPLDRHIGSKVAIGFTYNSAV